MINWVKETIVYFLGLHLSHVLKTQAKSCATPLLKFVDKRTHRFQMNNILMVHVGRSGSTVLGDLLRQHSQIKWGGEIYAYILDMYRNKKFNRKRLAIWYLKNCMSGTYRKYYGFEVKFYHLNILGENLHDYIQSVKNMGVDKFVVLKRKNFLRVIVSYLVAQQTKLWHITSDEISELAAINICIEKVCIDKEEKPLLEFLEEYDLKFQELENILNHVKTIKLSYEEHLYNDPIIAYHLVCDFLGLTYEKPVVRHQKVTPFRLSEVISNFNELERYLDGTPYAWMLHD